MGAPIPEIEAAGDATAEALLSSLKTIDPAERRKHATVFNYWHSIRGNRQFPPIRDLDPLEISDAGPWSILLEMIGGGDDAVVRHFGQSIRLGLEVEKIGDAPNPSLLASIHNKLPIVAACRQAFAFEEAFETESGTTRCWVTLLPFSEIGTWIDYVYGFVSLGPPPGAVEAAAELVDEESQAVDEEAEAVEDVTDLVEQEPLGVHEAPVPAEEAFEPFKVPLRPLDEEPESMEEAAAAAEPAPEPVAELPEPGPEPEPVEQAFEPVSVDEPEPDPERVEQMFEPVLVDEPEPEPEPLPEPEPVEQAFEPVSVDEPEPELEPAAASKPSFSAKIFESLASVSGFYGQAVQAEPTVTSEIVADEAITEFNAEPTCDVEGTLHSKLSEVRAKAEEARIAQERSIIALHEGLSAAYDFALDAEEQPEEYLRLVEAQGLKIQLRSPMKPVVKLAFDGTCDEASIAELEAVLAWAFKMDLPRGTLAERIEAEGGIGQILNG